MTHKQTILRSRRGQVLMAAQRHGASKIMICGSVANGKDKPDSDYDFIVEMEPGKSLMDLGALQMDLQEILGEEVDILTNRSLRGAMKKSLYSEAREL